MVIASALAQTADGDGAGLLLLDEPTASLDLRYQLEIGALRHDGCAKERGITMLLSTHDLHFAASVCTEIVLLAAGACSPEGTPRGDAHAGFRGHAVRHRPASLPAAALAKAGRS